MAKNDDSFLFNLFLITFLFVILINVAPLLFTLIYPNAIHFSWVFYWITIPLSGLLILGVGLIAVLTLKIKGDSQTYIREGINLREKGDLERAIQSLNTAIEMNPSSFKAYSIRGLALTEKGNLEAAIQDFNQMVKLVPKNPIAHYYRGVTYLDQGEKEKALHELETAANLFRQQKQEKRYQETVEFIRELDRS
ncbi:Tetratricopeptide TPR_1 repeat-containing protein [Halothece sp. PCC 7418]|uniref:tetratricopeptide repeat protein n=1 Tax=Halothece sp. (strain PCC 7418) TaxID=65093 RepID=UPI0002A05FD1|nr:tetratricopeptide repeat protein [Halothece sp. PCC 7418]AFZ45463.1 Tetratricopeptide TPR_1 repeat-containing protein [Halothece sp. PCC 7418]